TPALAALLCYGGLPPVGVAALGLLTVFAGYTAVYALNDVDVVSAGAGYTPATDTSVAVTVLSVPEDVIYVKGKVTQGGEPKEGVKVSLRLKDKDGQEVETKESPATDSKGLYRIDFTEGLDISEKYDLDRVAPDADDDVMADLEPGKSYTHNIELSDDGDNVAVDGPTQCEQIADYMRGILTSCIGVPQGSSKQAIEQSDAVKSQFGDVIDECPYSDRHDINFWYDQIRLNDRCGAQECINGRTQYCTIDDGSRGVQTCSNEKWSDCVADPPAGCDTSQCPGGCYSNGSCKVYCDTNRCPDGCEVDSTTGGVCSGSVDCSQCDDCQSECDSELGPSEYWDCIEACATSDICNNCSTM
ncbi:MAG: hypothetical protein PHQ54_03450, partial [Candidatus Omnitrophica bacterium]|nr:hypothetical protein [Candidatus Omnitrophota bacterium]